MTALSVDGVPQKDLDECIEKLEDLARWSREKKLDRWAFRAALLKALYDNADAYFVEGGGDFREIAAFDNGVATVLRSVRDVKNT
ncbi:MAG: hypothetical protein OK439_00610 [Thaumarchaeota archaeon]|nr:hypothetical protein [Nitrososphaerota archaeon]